MRRLAARTEDVVATLALGGIMLLPLAEIAGRRFLGAGIPGAGPFAQNLTLWVGLLGAAIAAREGKLLTLATGEFLPAKVSGVAHVIAACAGAIIATMFAVGGASLVGVERAAGDVIAAHVPVWVAVLVFPFGFSLIALRLVRRAAPTWRGRSIAALGIVLGLVLASHP